jgi:hypothetical protein
VNTGIAGGGGGGSGQDGAPYSSGTGGTGGGYGGAGGNFIPCEARTRTTDLFLPPQTIAYPAQNLDVLNLALADFDGDGLDDVILGDHEAHQGAGGIGGMLDGHLEVALADRDKLLAPWARYPGVDPGFLAIADVNGDKHPDLLSASYTLLTPMLLLNAGAGAFSAPAAFPYSFTNHVTAIASGDFDGDGTNELVFGMQGPSAPGIMLLSGAGGSNPVATTYDGGANVFSLAVGDVDGRDGLDVVAAVDSVVHVLLNDGHGHLQPPISFDGLSSISLLDIDGDGKLDIVGYGSGIGAEVLTNVGNGRFASVPRYLNLGVDGAPAFGDVNGDGKVDAVVSSAACTSLAVYLNDGSGSFSNPSYIADGGMYPVALGDVNGDKQPDIVMPTPAGVEVRLHRAP